MLDDRLPQWMLKLRWEIQKKDIQKFKQAGKCHQDLTTVIRILVLGLSRTTENKNGARKNISLSWCEEDTDEQNNPLLTAEIMLFCEIIGQKLKCMDIIKNKLHH